MDPSLCLLVVVEVLDKQAMVVMVVVMDLVDLVLVDLELLNLVLVEHKVEVAAEVLVVVNLVDLGVYPTQVIMLFIEIMVELVVVLGPSKESVVVVVAQDIMVAEAVVDLTQLTALGAVVEEDQESLHLLGLALPLKMV
jgi:hypothetical protein